MPSLPKKQLTDGCVGICSYKFNYKFKFSTNTIVLRGGSAVGRWTCDLQVAGSIPGRWLSRNIGQLSLASLRGR